MWTKEEKRAYGRRYYAENKEKAASNHKKWSAENKEKVNAIGRQWRAENPEKSAVSARRSQVKGVENLADYYVSQVLAQRKGIHQTAKQLREYPEIIECFRAIMKLKRICRTKKKQKL